MTNYDVSWSPSACAEITIYLTKYRGVSRYPRVTKIQIAGILLHFSSNLNTFVHRSIYWIVLICLWLWFANLLKSTKLEKKYLTDILYFTQSARNRRWKWMMRNRYYSHILDCIMYLLTENNLHIFNGVETRVVTILCFFKCNTEKR